MNLFENIQLALAGLRAGKMRALLTMLGIIIGIGSVIAIVTIGNSLTISFTESMQSLGMSNIEMDMYYVGDNSWAYLSMEDMIQDEMIFDLLDHFPDEILAAGMNETLVPGQARDGRRYANGNLLGVSPGTLITNQIEMVEGRFILDRDYEGMRNVVVISEHAANKMFGNGSAIGQELQIYMEEEILTFTVVGVYKYERSGYMTGPDEDVYTEMYIPVPTALRIGGWGAGYYWFMITTAPGVDPQAFATQAQDYMNRRFYDNNENWEIMAYSMESMLGEVTQVMTNISLAIAVIAAISLLVGGIGVMNIMLVSVTERTREIGTRKALGARNSAIRIQFIVESMIICLIGGIIGIGLGLGLGTLGASILEAPAVPSYAAIVLAVGFSMVIGVFFGYYPASKAAKLDPIEALRYE